MRYILIILFFLSVGADAQMVIKAHPNYRPFAIDANLLLDDYPNAAAAYSLRKLDKDYAGSAIRVRKDTTGQPEQDIGFLSSGELDTVSLKSFLNARSGFVVTWYDQSGNARNATQATQAIQPRIADLGVIERRNNKIVIQFGGNAYLQNNVNGYDINNISHYAVSSRNASANTIRTVYSTGILTTSVGFGILYSQTSAPYTQDRLYQQIRNTSTAQDLGDYINTLGVNNLFFGISISSTDYSYYNGGDEKTISHTRTNATSNNRTVIGARLNNTLTTYSQFLNGTISEIVFWQSNQSSNRTAIQNNINTYYSIY